MGSSLSQDISHSQFYRGSPRSLNDGFKKSSTSSRVPLSNPLQLISQSNIWQCVDSIMKASLINVRKRIIISNLAENGVECFQERQRILNPERPWKKLVIETHFRFCYWLTFEIYCYDFAYSWNCQLLKYFPAHIPLKYTRGYVH